VAGGIRGHVIKKFDTKTRMRRETLPILYCIWRAVIFLI
jgi:hypothetical protein